VGGLFIGG